MFFRTIYRFVPPMKILRYFLVLSYTNEIQYLFFSFWLFPIMIFVLISQLPVNTAGKVTVNRYKNKVLVGYSYRNITSLNHKKCLEFCLADCRCLSFQICAASQDCQLSSSTKLVNRSAFQDSEHCDYMDFQYEDTTKPKVIIMYFFLKNQHVPWSSI